MLSHVMKDGTERPIAYASRSLSKAERNYSQIEREALSIVWGISTFHTYLYLNKFTLVTPQTFDHTIQSRQRYTSISIWKNPEKGTLFNGL